MKKLIDRDAPGAPDINLATVNLRDVAAAHLSALTSPDSAGQRFLCAEKNHSMREVAVILQEHLDPLGYKIPTMKIPAIALRVVALWDKTARLAPKDLGQRQDLDPTQIRRVLHRTSKDLREMTVSMTNTMIRNGVVATGP